jgi:hypothetical protein
MILVSVAMRREKGGVTKAIDSVIADDMLRLASARYIPVAVAVQQAVARRAF